MLAVISTAEIALSKVAQKRIWRMFLDGGTNHSANASTLAYLIRRCELEGVPYKLNAYPGTGYFMEPIKGEKS
jgi:hypothetical protein